MTNQLDADCKYFGVSVLHAVFHLCNNLFSPLCQILDCIYAKTTGVQCLENELIFIIISVNFPSCSVDPVQPGEGRFWGLYLLSAHTHKVFRV